jgi:hypothetical protein
MIFRRQRHQKCQFQLVQRGFDAPESMAAHRDIMGCKRQMEQLLVIVGGEFGKRKLIQWQQNRSPWRNFNAQTARLGVGRVAFR